MSGDFTFSFPLLNPSIDSMCLFSLSFSWMEAERFCNLCKFQTNSKATIWISAWLWKMGCSTEILLFWGNGAALLYPSLAADSGTAEPGSCCCPGETIRRLSVGGVSRRCPLGDGCTGLVKGSPIVQGTNGAIEIASCLSSLMRL